MRDHFRTLLAHDHWANNELLTALAAATDAPPRARELCAHIMATHRFWELRLTGTPLDHYDFWPELSLDECAAQNDEYGEKWPRYLDALPSRLPSSR